MAKELGENLTDEELQVHLIDDLGSLFCIVLVDHVTDHMTAGDDR